MNLATKRARAAGPGALIGAAAGFVVVALDLSNLAGAIDHSVVVMVFAALGALAAAAGLVRWLSIAAGTLLALYVIVAFTPLAAWLSASWVRVDAATTPPREIGAVVVLSSGLLSDSALDHHGIDRLLSAVELVKRLHVNRLVTTRVWHRFRAGSVTSDFEQQQIVALADLEPRWTVVDSVYTTRDEAIRAARALFPMGVHSIAVVTSPMHTRRACATFEGVGFTVWCQAAREHKTDTRAPERPSDRLDAFGAYVYERLGMMKYRWAGWLSKPL